MKNWQIFTGLIILLVVLVVLVIVKPDPQSTSSILTGINLFLVFGYVVATLNMMKMNQMNIKSLKMPVITLTLQSWPQKKEDADEHESINEIMLIMTNKTKNYAHDVKVKVSALINGREFEGSHPINGEKKFFVQAEHAVIQRIKMEEEFLSRAQLSIERMIELADESNFDKQFILKMKMSHSDGFGDTIPLPELSWYYDFLRKAWNFIG